MPEPLTPEERGALARLGVFVTVERAVEYIRAALAAVPRLASPAASWAAGERDVLLVQIAEKAIEALSWQNAGGRLTRQSAMRRALANYRESAAPIPGEEGGKP